MALSEEKRDAVRALNARVRNRAGKLKKKRRRERKNTRLQAMTNVKLSKPTGA